MSENRKRGRNAIVTGKRQVETTTHAVTLDRCIYGSRKFRYEVHELLPHVREGIRIAGREQSNLRQVRTRGKEFGIAGDHQWL